MLENNSRSINCLYIWDFMFYWYFRTHNTNTHPVLPQTDVGQWFEEEADVGGPQEQRKEERETKRAEWDLQIRLLGHLPMSPRCPPLYLLHLQVLSFSPSSHFPRELLKSIGLSIYLSMHVSTFSVLSVRPSVPFCSRFVRCLYGK